MLRWNNYKYIFISWENWNNHWFLLSLCFRIWLCSTLKIKMLIWINIYKISLIIRIVKIYIKLLWGNLKRNIYKRSYFGGNDCILRFDVLQKWYISTCIRNIDRRTFNQNSWLGLGWFKLIVLDCAKFMECHLGWIGIFQNICWLMIDKFNGCLLYARRSIYSKSR